MPAVVHKLNACYEHRHDDSPIPLETADDIDMLIDQVRNAYPDECAMVEITHADDPYRHGALDVGICGDVGVIYYGGSDYRDGCYSKGNQSTDYEVVYYYMGHDREFPQDAEIPLDTVRQAIHEFQQTLSRPSVVEWQDAGAWREGRIQEWREAHREMDG